MTIIFYTQSNEPNSFPKALGNGDNFDGYLRNECDILNPVIDMVSGMSTLNYNYAYIPEFKRYYFIMGIDIIPSRKDVGSSALFNYSISMHVDVLQSWRSNILGHEALVARTSDEEKVDKLIVDENLVTYPNYTYKFINHNSTNSVFETSLNATSKNIVLLVGNTVPGIFADIEPTPQLFAMEAALTGAYILSVNQLNVLRAKLFDQDIFRNWLNIYGNMSQFILGMYCYPFVIPNAYYGASSTIILADTTLDGTDGNLILPFADAPLQTFRFVSDIFDDEEYIPKFMDYTPITEYEIFLPFFGYVTLENDHLINYRYIDVEYSLNITSGVLFVRMFLDKPYYTNPPIIYENTTSIAVSVPIMGADTTALRNMAVNSAVGLVSGAASVGLGMLGSTTTGSVSTSKTITSKAKNPNTNRLINTGQETTSTSREFKSNKSSPISMSFGAGEIIRGIGNGLQLHANVSNSGKFSSENSLASMRKCYIRKKQFEYRYPENYYNIMGGICNKTFILSELKGLTKITECHLNIPCTFTELEEIDGLLKSGVIIN